MINIKVDGILNLKQLRQLDGMNIPFAGLNLVKTDITAKELKDADLDVKATGIFTDEEYDEIIAATEKYELGMVQLNGDESAALCEDLSEEIEVIKTFRITADVSSVDKMIADYDEVCDYYLFDLGEEGNLNSTEKKGALKKITDAKIEKPFFLSGGIGEEDAPVIKKFKHPDFYGVCIDRKFDKEPGIKDMGAVLKFAHALK